MIQIYQLWKSQLLFSQAQHMGEHIFNVFPSSTAVSHVMSDEMYQECGILQKNHIFPLTDLFRHVFSSRKYCISNNNSG